MAIICDDHASAAFRMAVDHEAGREKFPLDLLVGPAVATSFPRLGKSGIGGLAERHLPKAIPLHLWFELLGAVAALITTFAWLPQIMKILRERQARDISLATTAALAFGVFLWVVYGLAIGSVPVIAANTVSFLFIAAIVGLKLHFG